MNHFSKFNIVMRMLTTTEIRYIAFPVNFKDVSTRDCTTVKNQGVWVLC